MPVSKPTIAAAVTDTTAGLKTSIQTATDGICDAIDVTNTAVAGTITVANAATPKAALLAWITAVKQYLIVTNTYKPNAEPIPAALANAFTTLEAALA